MREIFCQWFALCTRAAAGTVLHPALGAVPTCRDCADAHDLALEEYPATVGDDDRTESGPKLI